MSETVQASNGQAIPIGDLSLDIATNEDGSVNTLTVSYQSITYVQTYSYNDDGTISNISQWVAQS